MMHIDDLAATLAREHGDDPQTAEAAIETWGRLPPEIQGEATRFLRGPNDESRQTAPAAEMLLQLIRTGRNTRVWSDWQ